MKQESYDDGYDNGVSHGKSQGISQGTDNAKVEDIRKIMLKFQYTPVQAMEVLDIPKENQDKYMKMLLN